MSERAKSRKRKKKQVSGKLIVTVGVLTLAAAGTAFGYYINQSRQYETVFFPHTVINGLDVSHKTTEEVKALISAEIEDYQLEIQLRGGETERITGEEIGLKSVFDGSLEQYLDEQEPMKWWQYRSQTTEYEITTMIEFEEEKVRESLERMACWSEELTAEPENAYLSEYQSGVGYEIIPETAGNRLKPDVAEQAVLEAVRNLKTEISLEEAEAYVEPEIKRDQEALVSLAAELNRYVGVTVTYRFGDKKEILNGDQISQWISVGEDQQVILDRDGVAAYVKQLASVYDTAYKKKEFQTSYGKTVTVSPSVYGWRINRNEETEVLYEILCSGESTEREPVYSQKANQHGTKDYGDTYVEINLTAQRLFFYKDGKLIVETDFVSGNHAKGYDTPAGAYPLTYKQRNATLRGETYETPVSYWMPFNGNIGMHDATWRLTFGGQIYRTNGSHGCINLPPEAAKKIFEQISAGDPVICYHLEGTERGTKPAVETPKETTAAETTTAAEPTSAAETTTATEPTSVAETTAAAEPTSAAETTAAIGPGTVTETTAAIGPGAVTETTAAIGPGAAAETEGYGPGYPLSE